MNRYIIVFSAILALGGTATVSADETGMGKTSPRTTTTLAVGGEQIQDETGMGFVQTTNETIQDCSTVSSWLGLCQRTK